MSPFPRERLMNRNEKRKYPLYSYYVKKYKVDAKDISDFIISCLRVNLPSIVRNIFKTNDDIKLPKMTNNSLLIE